MRIEKRGIERSGVRTALPLLWLAFAWVAPAAAQQAPVSPTPLAVLLESREALGLTADQVERLQVLRDSLAGRNEPLVTRMLELRTRWQRERRGTGRAGAVLRLEQNAALLGIREAAQPLNQQIQANNRAAMQEVNRLLTPEQRRRLRELVQERRPPPGVGASSRPSGRAAGRLAG
jgi:hypothetical protein